MQLRHSLNGVRFGTKTTIPSGPPTMFPLHDPLPECEGLRLDDLVLTATTAVAVVVSTSTTVPCPRCGTASDRVHSRYRRMVADLPGPSRPLALRLVVRRFRCITPNCPQQIFCERLPGLLVSHAHCTTRLADAHRAIGFALGGEAGARLADSLDRPTSPDTLLRRVTDAPREPAPPPRYVGVDDWAIRKGQRYGTILIDLERGRVIDILPGRDGEALKAWLRAHPGVELITRDRWAAFAQAATEAAPQAKQVADRWHLLKNLRETVERLFERHTAVIQDALQAAPPEASIPDESATELPAPASAPRLTPEPEAASPRAQADAARRQRRGERYEHVRRLHGAGKSIRHIAKELGLSRGTVRRYLRQDHCPQRKPGQLRPTQLDGFGDYIDRRIREGCRNAAELRRELAARGGRASSSTVRRFVNRRLAAAGQLRERSNAAPVCSPAPPSPRKLSFEFIKQAVERKAEEQTRMDLLRGCAGEELREGFGLAEEFAAMARKESRVPLAEWLAKAATSRSPELRGFAGGLGQDEAAVAAALTERWSNAQVEGQVNRLKVIKRQMYGRAGFPLLRARVRHAG